MIGEFVLYFINIVALDELGIEYHTLLYAVILSKVNDKILKNALVSDTSFSIFLLEKMFFHTFLIHIKYG